MTKINNPQQNPFFSSRFSLLIIVSGAIMIGHSARMIYQGLFHPDSYYSPNMFDIIFDWATLLVVGIVLFYFGLRLYYVRQQNLIH